MEQEYIFSYQIKVSNNVDSKIVTHYHRAKNPDENRAIAKAVNSVMGELAHDFETPPEEQCVTAELLSTHKEPV